MSWCEHLLPLSSGGEEKNHNKRSVIVCHDRTSTQRRSRGVGGVGGVGGVVSVGRVVQVGVDVFGSEFIP